MIFLFIQVGEHHEARLGEEDKQQHDGVQVYGEHQRVPGGSEGDGCASAGDLPDRGPVGAAEPQLRSHLPAVPRQKGRPLGRLLQMAEKTFE